MSGALPPGAWWVYASTGQKPPPADHHDVNAENFLQLTGLLIKVSNIDVKEVG